VAMLSELRLRASSPSAVIICWAELSWKPSNGRRWDSLESLSWCTNLGLLGFVRGYEVKLMGFTHQLATLLWSWNPLLHGCKTFHDSRNKHDAGHFFNCRFVPFDNLTQSLWSITILFDDFPINLVN
jgi:hypothetical protein